MEHYRQRRARLWRLLKNTVDAAVILQPANVRYLSGFSGSEATLVCTPDDTLLLTDGRYATQARQQTHDCRVVTFRDKLPALVRVLRRCRAAQVGIEAAHTNLAFGRRIEAEAPEMTLVDCDQCLSSLRSRKTGDEITQLRRAAQIAAQSLAAVRPRIRPGVSERAIAAALVHEMMLRGASGAAFPSIVASGPRSALPHGLASDKLIRTGELVTIDYGAVVDGYCSDETCTFVVGRATAKQRRLYELVLKAHDHALAQVRPGMAAREIDAAARQIIEQAGLGSRFGHGTGHGVGLCVHEGPTIAPRSADILRQGMVITIEPGVYLPGWGGIRIEDTVAVTRSGYRPITQTPKQFTLLPV